MRHLLQKGAALVLALLCLSVQGLAAAEETAAETVTSEVVVATEEAAEETAASEEETTRYMFNYGIDAFDARFKEIYDTMNNSYSMGLEPDIENAYEYHLPNNVYAKVLVHDEKIEFVLLFLSAEYAENQSYLWQSAAIMAAAVGDIPANQWAILLVKATNLTLDTETVDQHWYVAGNTIMICQSDPDDTLLYAILEREEYARSEDSDVTEIDSLQESGTEE